MTRAATRAFAVILVAAAAVATSFAAPEAQIEPRTRVPRVGYVSLASSGDARDPGFAAFRQGLRELGYIEGKNVVVDARFARGHSERVADLVAEVLALKVDVLVVGSSATALAAKRATTTVPVVFVNVIDPVAPGLVASLARPGGNVTGVAGWVGATGFAGKWLELLKEAAPRVSHVAVLANGANPQTATQLDEITVAARTLNVKLDVLEGGGPASLDKALAAVTASRADGVVVVPDPFFTANHTRIVGFAAKNRLPAVYFYKRFADAGGLMAYGPAVEESYRRAATYVDKILKGAKPADLPVEQATKFELAVNMKAARALGLTVPPTLRLRADHLIE